MSHVVKIQVEFKISPADPISDAIYTDDEIKELLAVIVEDALKGHQDIDFESGTVKDSDGLLDIKLTNIRALK